MKKTNEQRVRIAQDYHTGSIGRARRLTALLLDDFFSRGLEYLTPEEQHLLEMNLLSNYDTIAAVLNTVLTSCSPWKQIWTRRLGLRQPAPRSAGKPCAPFTA